MKKDGESLAEQLAKFRLFAGMPREEIAAVVGSIHGEIRSFRKGEAVVYEGTKAKWIVPVLSGRLTIFESGSGGVRRPMRLVGRGEIVHPGHSRFVIRGIV